jgi:hypothetical protein
VLAWRVEITRRGRGSACRGMREMSLLLCGLPATIRTALTRPRTDENASYRARIGTVPPDSLSHARHP